MSPTILTKKKKTVIWPSIIHLITTTTCRPPMRVIRTSTCPSLMTIITIHMVHIAIVNHKDTIIVVSSTETIQIIMPMVFITINVRLAMIR